MSVPLFSLMCVSVVLRHAPSFQCFKPWRQAQGRSTAAREGYAKALTYIGYQGHSSHEGPKDTFGAEKHCSLLRLTVLGFP